MQQSTFFADTHLRYRFTLFWSDQDTAFIADIPDLRFCSAAG